MTAAYQLTDIKVYRDQSCILDIPALSLPQNNCIALLGDNGAGKSTLLDLLAFTTAPNKGEIIFAGHAIQPPLSAAQRRTIGYVSQHPYLLAGTVIDNLKLALRLQDIDSQQHSFLIHQALELVDLHHIATQPAHTLSGGELKRAAIARATVYQPDILLLDEPFSHLDQSHRQQLEDIIEQLAQQQNKTIIFSTHDRLQGLSLADSSINLVNGKTTESPLLNLFSGQLNYPVFDTGHLHIHTTSTLINAHHIAIDPREIIISRQALKSSMRNQFSGRLTLIAEESNAIRLTIDCEEQFHALISSDSLAELNLSLGDTIWLSFKSTAVSVF
ncbi:MAG: ATP-binding cassette domain-containing protein [Piscirickettsiaceae bacterium]|nr:ATP-binding cassette domain-containing protein [Piscirickettsiaceae bacterium]